MRRFLLWFAAHAALLICALPALGAPVDGLIAYDDAWASIDVGDVDGDGAGDRFEAHPLGPTGCGMARVVAADGRVLAVVDGGPESLIGIGVARGPTDSTAFMRCVTGAVEDASGAFRPLTTARLVRLATLETVAEHGDAVSPAWIGGRGVEVALGLRPLEGDLDDDGRVDADDVRIAVDLGGALVERVARFVGAATPALETAEGARWTWAGAVERGQFPICIDCEFTGGGGRPGGGGAGGGPSGPGSLGGDDGDRPKGGVGGGVPWPGCPGDHDCDGVPDAADCDAPGFAGDPCDCDLDGDGVAERDEDDDCDGVPNGEDCDSPCFDGDPACCIDADGDGLIAQEDPDSPCYRPPPLRLLRDSNGDDVIDGDDEPIPDDDAGVVLLVNSLDADADGFPDLADGMNVLDSPAVTEDDICVGGSLLRVALRVQGLESDDEIAIEYDASDPSNIDLSTLEPNPGSLRLWTANARVMRDPLSIDGGGDWIPPGEYALSELTGGSPPVRGDDGAEVITFLVEAMRPSLEAGDLGVTFRAAAACDANVTLPITAVQVEIEARGRGEVSWERWPVLVASMGTPPGLRPLPETLLEGPRMEHRIRVNDPRESDAVNAFTLGVHTLPLTPDGSASHVTPAFMCASAAHINDGGFASPVLEVSSGPIGFAWNPEGVLHVNVDLRKVPAHQRQVVELVENTTRHMKEQRWPWWNLTTKEAADDGLFGKEVHRRIARVLAASGDEQWLINVVVDRNTNKIVRFSEQSGRGLVQLDLLRVESGYAPAIGETLDQSRIIDALDIKTSVQGELTADQQRRLSRAAGKDPLVVRSVNRYTHRMGWHINDKVVKRGRLARALNLTKKSGKAKVAGGAMVALGTFFAIQALINHSDYDAELEDVVNEIEYAARLSPYSYQFGAAWYIAMQSLTNYLGHFTPDPSSVQAIGYVTFLKVYGGE